MPGKTDIEADISAVVDRKETVELMAPLLGTAVFTVACPVMRTMAVAGQASCTDLVRSTPLFPGRKRSVMRT
jgi:hypothetical protein